MARFIIDIVKDPCHEPWLEFKSDLIRRRLDRQHQLVAGHRTDVHLSALHAVGEGSIRQGVAHEVAAQRQHHRNWRVGAGIEQELDEALSRLAGRE